MNKEELLEELILKQKKGVIEKKRLYYNDFRRIVKYTEKSLFGNECVPWKGAVRSHNSKYVCFYFRNGKFALHRLLYNNFVGSLSEGEYIYFSCENKGECCCIHHIHKKNTKPRMKIVMERKVNNEDVDELLTLRFE